jgi:hypothetical protein
MTLSMGQLTYAGVSLGPSGTAQVVDVRGLTGLPVNRKGGRVAPQRPGHAGRVRLHGRPPSDPHARGRRQPYERNHHAAAARLPANRLLDVHHLRRRCLRLRQRSSHAEAGVQPGRGQWGIGSQSGGHGPLPKVLCHRGYRLRGRQLQLRRGQRGSHARRRRPRHRTPTSRPPPSDSPPRPAASRSRSPSPPLSGRSPARSFSPPRRVVLVLALHHITGPCQNPRIEQQTTGVTVTFNTTLSNGDSLVVDAYAGTAVLNGVASRLNTLAPGSYITALTVPPGSSTFGFYSSDASATGATMTVAWANCWA